ncbi:glycerophosphoryl diester phosphodiesterase [Alteromonadaceae bacterium 2753L.S.0a.02]|nr:glycerophosphoryl diester phosphodiesterase [Alteromonadaceae bacterium 2753L.S.0a.02]
MSHLSAHKFRLVGHRGNPADFPENSREGIQSILDNKIDSLELDIQLSQDATCFVIHDDHTRRVGHQNFLVCESHSSELTETSVHEPARFGERFFPSYMLTLKQACEQMSRYKGEIFLELKNESLQVCDAETFVSLVEEDSRCVAKNRRFISYDFQIVQQAKLHQLACGWVLNDYTEQNLTLAQQLSPDFLIINYRRLPDEQDVLWPGNWAWFLYDITDVAEAQKWAARGATYIESWSPLSLKS